MLLVPSNKYILFLRTFDMEDKQSKFLAYTINGKSLNSLSAHGKGNLFLYFILSFRAFNANTCNYLYPHN